MSIPYKVILVDCPWQFVDKLKHTTSGAEAQYATLSTKELAELPIAQLGTDETACFCWATVAMLEDAMACLMYWDFKFKTLIVWDKMRIGMGAWFRNRVEICLVGVRSKTKAFHCQLPNIIQAPRQKHSAKPVEMYQYIEAASPGPYLELFARTPREGWDQTGLEMDGVDVREAIKARI